MELKKSVASYNDVMTTILRSRSSNIEEGFLYALNIDDGSVALVYDTDQNADKAIFKDYPQSWFFYSQRQVDQYVQISNDIDCRRIQLLVNSER